MLPSSAKQESRSKALFDSNEFRMNDHAHCIFALGKRFRCCQRLVLAPQRLPILRQGPRRYLNDCRDWSVPAFPTRASRSIRTAWINVEQGSLHADAICRSKKSNQKIEIHSLRGLNSIEAGTVASRFNSTHWNGHYSQYFGKMPVFYGPSNSRMRMWREGITRILSEAAEDANAPD